MVTIDGDDFTMVNGVNVKCYMVNGVNVNV
jgi:hypothetical protein